MKRAKDIEFAQNEKIVQIIVGYGSERPFLMSLTNKGRVFSSPCFGDGWWEELVIPKSGQTKVLNTL
jgi:hypothetical protein